MIKALLIVLAITSTASAQWFPRLQKHHVPQQCNGPECEQRIIYQSAPIVTYQVVPNTTYQSTCNCLTTGVCTCQNCTCGVSTKAAPSASRRDFRGALLDAAKQAQAEGSIKTSELIKISVLARNPRILDRIQSAVSEAASIKGAVVPTASGDWSDTIALIKELLPLIIELLEFFIKF